MTASGSTVVRRQVGRRLRALREIAGKAREDVAVTKICSHAKLEKIESGPGSIRPGDVRELGLFYRADQATIDELATLAYATSEPDWWEQFRDSMHPTFGISILDFPDPADPPIVYLEFYDGARTWRTRSRSPPSAGASRWSATGPSPCRSTSHEHRPPPGQQPHHPLDRGGALRRPGPPALKIPAGSAGGFK